MQEPFTRAVLLYCDEDETFAGADDELETGIAFDELLCATDDELAFFDDELVLPDEDAASFVKELLDSFAEELRTSLLDELRETLDEELFALSFSLDWWITASILKSFFTPSWNRVSSSSSLRTTESCTNKIPSASCSSNVSDTLSVPVQPTANMEKSKAMT